MASGVSINSCDDDIPQEGSHVENLLDTLLSFQQRSLFCDTVMLTSNGGTVFAHSAVLAAVCPGLLTSLNQKPFMLHQPNIIDFAQYDSPLIEKLVVFFYTGRLCPDDAGPLVEILNTLGVAFKLIDMDTEASFAADDTNAEAAFTADSENAIEIKHELEHRIDYDDVLEVNSNEVIDSNNLNSESRILSSEEGVRSNDTNESKDLVTICGDNDLAATISSESIVRTDKLNYSTRTKRKYTKRKLTGKPIDSVDAFIDPSFYANVDKSREPNTCKEEETNDDSIPLDEKLFDVFGDGAVFVDANSSVFSDIEGNGRYVCSMCDATFTRRTAFNRHKFEHYRTEDGLYRCNACPKIVKLKDSLTRHLRWHEETDMGVVRDPKSHEGDTDRKKSKPHECPVCSHRFITPSRLKAHLNTHSGARPHMCDQCGNRYNDSNELTKHKRRHRGDQRYECEVCGRKFYTSKLRSIHVKTHTGDKPYQCTDCGARFTQMPSLKCHMLVHTGELPYRCHVCPKSFRRPTRLKLHILNAHTVHTERPFVCAICGRGFSLRGYLAQHAQTHEGNKRGKKGTKPFFPSVSVDNVDEETRTVNCTETFENVYIISDVTVKGEGEEMGGDEVC